MQETRKAINFDLEEKALKRLYPSKWPFGYKRAWSVVKSFMLNHGFEHRQYSGYVSKEPMSYHDLKNVLTELSKELPWVGPCSIRFDVTEVGETYSVIDVLLGDDEASRNTRSPRREQSEPSPTSHKTVSFIRDLDDFVRRTKENAEKERPDRAVSRHDHEER